MAREEIIEKVLQGLEDAGYDAFYCAPTHGCFDIAARRNQAIVLVKVLENIDGFTRIHAQDLQVVAKMLGASCFLVGAKSKEYELEKGVLYERHGITVFNQDTFREVIGGGEAHAKKFRKMMVPVDSQALRLARLDAGFSIEALAQKAKISSDTVYRYEHSITMATPKHIRTLEEVLGVGNLAVPAVSKLQTHINAEPNPHRFRFFGMDSIRLGGPVDIVSKKKEKTDAKDKFEGKENATRNKQEEEDLLKRVGTIIADKDRDSRTLESKADTFDGLSHILQSYSCFFVKKSSKTRIKNVPVVTEEELKRIKNSQELIELIGSKAKR